MKPVRLDALLSRYGYCSRSEARAWVKDGRVTATGRAFSSPSDKASPGTVQVDGEPVEFPDGLLVLLHKPADHVCSHDPGEGPSVYDLLPPRWLMRNPVVTTIGRLDKDATGVLLITDDGDYLHRVISPRRHVPKTYLATLDRPLTGREAALFASGELMLEGEDKPLLPAELAVIDETHARLTITEGRYHQVRRMFAAVGNHVNALHRERIGGLILPEDHEPGQYRILSADQAEGVFDV